MVSNRTNIRSRIIPGLLVAAFFLFTLWYSLQVHYQDSWQEEMYKPGIKGKLLIIDPGHGGADPGAIVEGIKESDINLKLARELKVELEKAGAKVLLTREEKGDLVPDERMSYSQWMNNLQRRREFAQKNRGHILISVHVNTSNSKQASGGIVYRPRVNDKNVLLASNLQRRLNEFWSVERDAQEKGFAVINWDIMPSVLVEVGFLTNGRDRDLLMGQAGRHELAKAICGGIIDFYDELSSPMNEKPEKS